MWGLFGVVRVCLFDPTVLWDTTRMLCLHGGEEKGRGGGCDVPHQIGKNVPDTIYVEVHLNQVDTF